MNALPTSCLLKSKTIWSTLCACHNGVFRMIPDVPGIVETSSNLAIVEIGGGKAMFKILIRSSRDSMRECLAESLESAFSMAGMKVELSGDYPRLAAQPAQRNR